MSRPVIGEAARLPTLRRVLAKMHLRVTLFAVALTGLTVLFTGFAALGNYAERNVTLIARSASYTTAPSIVFDDPVAAREAVASILQPGVGNIAVIRADGTQLTSLSRQPDDNSLARIIADFLFFRAPVDMPVTHLGERIGTVQVHGEGSAIADYILAGFLGTFACIVITGIATTLLARRLRAEIVEPLDAMATVAHSFRREDSASARVPEASIREIEVLRGDFNALIEELAEWRQHMRHENATLSHQATHDSLTGLANRVLFERRADEIIVEARAGNASFVLIYADANGFKSVNDMHGHGVGDAVLVDMANRIGACARARDVTARLGGDEFAMLLAAPSADDAVERVSAEIAARMRDPFELPDGQRIAMSLSLGIAIYPRDGHDLSSLLAHADSAMYASKGVRPSPKEKGQR